MDFYKKYFNKENISVQCGIFGENNEDREYHLILQPSGESGNFEEQLAGIQNALTKLASSGEFRGAGIVFKRYFLSDAANQYAILKETEIPAGRYAVSVIQQPPLNGSKVALWVYMAGNIEISSGENHVVAERNGYRHIWTSQLHGYGKTSYEQTNDLLANYEKYLSAEGCSLKDNCIRTWLFVHNVDINYGGVVDARKEFFGKRNMVPTTHYISSTGIEGRNFNPGALVIADAYSVKGLKESQVKFLKATSHLNPTYEYGVTFERGTSVEYGNRKHIFISGTASINNKGEIVHPCNVLKQAERVMENVKALLAEAEAEKNDIAQMIVYLRDVADYKCIEQFFSREYPDIPKVIVLASVCRPGWLVEVECIAVKKQNQPGYQNF